MDIEINKTYTQIENNITYDYLILEMYCDGNVIVLCNNKIELEMPIESLSNCILKN
ncbi:hypothetical protein M0Q50_02025 [bacterium]|jgi:hypothetical protein|nr:hypothetical protein [bacterium]